jgi:hypothetical protein
MLSLMKIKQKNKMGLTFGDFVTAAYRNCGARRAANFVQVAFDARWVVFKRRPLFLDLSREGKTGTNMASGLIGRIKTGPGVALLAAVVGCAGLVNTGYSQIIVAPPRVEVVVPGPPVFVAPPIVVAPEPGFFFFGGPYDGRRDARDYGRRGHESRGLAHHDEHGPRGR